jgi:hypothetical protein
MLFALYLVEGWFGFSFTRAYFSNESTKGESNHLSLLLTGVAFITLALGNSWTTGRVLVTKSKSRQLKQLVHKRVASSIMGGTTRNVRADSVEGKKE